MQMSKLFKTLQPKQTCLSKYWMSAGVKKYPLNTAIITPWSEQMHTRSGEVIASLQKMQIKSLQNFAGIR
jgi:hypothetical protein